MERFKNEAYCISVDNHRYINKNNDNKCIKHFHEKNNTTINKVGHYYFE